MREYGCKKIGCEVREPVGGIRGTCHCISTIIEDLQGEIKGRTVTPDFLLRVALRRGLKIGRDDE